jgi:membrane protein implicated in regulation of membrane protease activity
MMLYMLLFVSVILTCALFATKQGMLGFPAVIFWSIAGGQAYILSAATWDIYYFVFFACMGMVIFCALAMYALRTKKEEIQEGEGFIDEVKDTTKFMDEGKDEGEADSSGGKSRLESAVEGRARKRREQGIKKKRLDLFTH